MRLLSCYISGYGKIANESFDLSKDCTVICEDNGWGKSTLASFIKVMLFGFADEGKRDEAINEIGRAHV